MRLSFTPETFFWPSHSSISSGGPAPVRPPAQFLWLAPLSPLAYLPIGSALGVFFFFFLKSLGTIFLLTFLADSIHYTWPSLPDSDWTPTRDCSPHASTLQWNHTVSRHCSSHTVPHIQCNYSSPALNVVEESAN